MNTTIDPTTVLVADDEPLIRRMVTRLLGTIQYQVMGAADGAEAVRLALEHRPGLILLDVHMADGGVEALRRLRADPRTRLIPVMLISGDSRPDTEITGLDGGADDYIVKPFDADELIARVRAVLRRNRETMAAHPLTGLPGAPAIEAEIDARRRRGERFCLLYADIDHFKSFNDRYGCARGDALIRRAAELLVKAAGPGGVAGHIGGDDFAVVCAPERAESIAHRLAAAFDEEAPRFYDPEDERRGYVEEPSREGELRRWPLAALSIAGVRGDAGEDYAALCESAARLKRTLKGLPGRGGSVYGFF